jgi:hypothetical protein
MGILYLIQPSEFLGTNRYKIGCSSKSTLERVKNGYKKGTRYLHILECENPFDIEKILKDEFNKKFKLFAGKEYFEGDEEEMKDVFYNTYDSYSKLMKLTPKQIRIMHLLDNNDDENKQFNDLFMFKAMKVSINPILPKTTVFINTTADEINEATTIIVDCDNNFSDEEKDDISKLGIHTIEDIIRCDKIDKVYKSRCIECYRFVKDQYELTGIEPFRGHDIIAINNKSYEIRIDFNGFITFIKPINY